MMKMLILVAGLGLASVSTVAGCTPAQQAQAQLIEGDVLKFIKANAGTIEELIALVTPLFPKGTLASVIENAISDAIDLLVSAGDVPEGSISFAISLRNQVAAKMGAK
jgi:hypothetical protein